MTYRVEGQGRLYESDTGLDGYISLYIQRKGMQLDWAPYRWWTGRTKLEIGEFTIESGLIWTTVDGRSNTHPELMDDFEAAWANIERVGFTFGSNSAGHGVETDGQVKFIIKDYRIV
jgi:hypothetical protein